MHCLSLKIFTESVYVWLPEQHSFQPGAEKECKLNIEVIWLMKELVPNHNTISNMRRDNEQTSMFN